MHKKNFNLLLLVIFAFLIGATGVLAFLNNASKPTVRSIEIIGDINSAVFANQTISISFNRPMNQDNSVLETNLKIKPEVKFSTKWNNNKIFIFFQEILKSDTKYVVDLQTDLEDKFKNRMNDRISFEFQTKKQEFTFLRKNEGGLDQVIRTNVDLNNEEVLFEAPEIEFYDINNKYLAVSFTVDQLSSTIELIDLETLNNQSFLQKVFSRNRQIVLKNEKVSSLDLSNNLDEFLYLSQKVKLEDGIVIPEGTGTTINRVKINDFSINNFNPNNFANDALSANYSRDGRLIIFRGDRSLYYLTDLTNANSATILGQFQSFGNINFDSSKILFTNFDITNTKSFEPFAITFNLSRQSNILTNKKEYVIDPKYFNNSNRYVYSRKYSELEFTQGFFELVLRNEKNEIVKTFKIEDFSLELPQTSLEDRFLSLEKYSKEQLQDLDNLRAFATQTKPGSGNIVLYDVENGKLIGEIVNAIDFRWVE